MSRPHGPAGEESPEVEESIAGLSRSGQWGDDGDDNVLIIITLSNYTS